MDSEGIDNITGVFVLFFIIIVYNLMLYKNDT